MYFRPRPEPPAPSPQPPRSIEASTMTATATIAPAAPIPTAQAHLGINAFPWANVTSVRNLDNGQSVDIGANLVTPAALDLAPGRYEVTLENGGKPVKRTVALEAGGDETLWVNFTDAASAKVPDFGGGQ